MSEVDLLDDVERLPYFKSTVCYRSNFIFMDFPSVR